MMEGDVLSKLNRQRLPSPSRGTKFASALELSPSSASLFRQDGPEFALHLPYANSNDARRLVGHLPPSNNDGGTFAVPP